MPDIYDAAIELMERKWAANPDRRSSVSYDAWTCVRGEYSSHFNDDEYAVVHTLFGYATENREHVPWCGCLTQVRRGASDACRDDLTDHICFDPRIPDSYTDIDSSNIQVFAEWQRRLDRELNRTVPALPTETPA